MRFQVDISGTADRLDVEQAIADVFRGHIVDVIIMEDDDTPQMSDEDYKIMIRKLSIKLRERLEGEIGTNTFEASVADLIDCGKISLIDAMIMGKWSHDKQKRFAEVAQKGLKRGVHY